MRPDLTEKQAVILGFIKSYTSHHSYPPSLREIANHVGVRSLSTVHQHLDAIERKGLLERSPSKERNLKTYEVPKLVRIPLLGEVAAGLPLEPVEDDDPVYVSTHLVASPENHYALRVRGNSMIEDNVQDGDMIIVKTQNYVNYIGEPIVALIDGGVTLKRFGGISEDGIVSLIPKNPEMAILKADASTFQIKGKMIGLIRSEV